MIGLLTRDFMLKTIYTQLIDLLKCDISHRFVLNQIVIMKIFRFRNECSQSIKAIRLW